MLILFHIVIMCFPFAVSAMYVWCCACAPNSVARNITGWIHAWFTVVTFCPVRLATWSFMHIVRCWLAQVLTCLNCSLLTTKIRVANVKMWSRTSWTAGLTGRPWRSWSIMLTQPGTVVTWGADVMNCLCHAICKMYSQR